MAESTHSPEAIAAGLKFLDALDNDHESAFLALFAGALSNLTIYDDGRCPHFGKAECEWIDDWRDFYTKRLVEAGLLTWEEGESGPALGMVKKPDGSMHTWTRVECYATGLGFQVREAWWARWREEVAARQKEASRGR